MPSQTDGNLFNIVVNMLELHSTKDVLKPQGTLEDAFSIDTYFKVDSTLKSDLAFYFYLGKDALSLNVSYARAIFREETILILFEKIEMLWRIIQEKPDSTLSELISKLNAWNLPDNSAIAFDLDLDF